MDNVQSLDFIWMAIYGLVSGALLVLVGLSAFFLSRLIGKFEDLVKAVASMGLTLTRYEQKVDDHINDTNIHVTHELIERLRNEFIKKTG